MIYALDSSYAFKYWLAIEKKHQEYKKYRKTPAEKEYNVFINRAIRNAREDIDPSPPKIRYCGCGCLNFSGNKAFRREWEQLAGTPEGAVQSRYEDEVFYRDPEDIEESQKFQLEFQLENICMTVVKYYPNMRKCGRCRNVYYVSREHQKFHWKHGHKEDCCASE